MSADWRADREKASRELLTIVNDRSSFVLPPAGSGPAPITRRWSPATFVSSLIETMLKADRTNLALLAIGFPAYGWAVHVYKNKPEGIERLREQAGWQDTTPTPTGDQA